MGDPSDAPEFVRGDFNSGCFSWTPVTPEGNRLTSEGYAEQSFPVPTDRVEYLLGAGWLHGEDGEDYRAYIDDTIIPDPNGGDREFQKVILRGSSHAVNAGSIRLMAGLLHRRPWEARQLTRRQTLDV